MNKKKIMYNLYKRARTWELGSE